MNKIVTIMLAAALMMSFAACTSKPKDEPVVEPPQQITESQTPGEGAVSGEDAAQSDAFERLYVADAAMYRGTLTEIKEDKDATVLVLEQAEGTDYGAPTMSFKVTPDTKKSFEDDRLTVGSYLEVFYGTAPGEKPDAAKTQEAIAINHHMEAAMVNFNGTLVSFEKDADKPNIGRLTMKELITGNEVVFNYSDEDTSFFINKEDLVPGANLNIFHRGIFTMSIPAQGSALEVRAYAENIHN